MREVQARAADLIDRPVLLGQADAFDHKEVKGQLSAASVDFGVLRLSYQVGDTAEHSVLALPAAFSATAASGSTEAWASHSYLSMSSVKWPYRRSGGACWRLA